MDNPNRYYKGNDDITREIISLVQMLEDTHLFSLAISGLEHAKECVICLEIKKWRSTIHG
jgi:hypothetical protein